ncbi:transmembrane protein 209 [Phymastichus coffea]|uniref:transmembrane protein 209 n=1 Tax=Phymastichus coffea TaxID=108790 RepID=UPI00273C945A|nr:transmembrane protein 209 [Phymastichus coffea]
MGDFHSPMRCISPSARVLTPKPQVQQTLEVRQTQKKAKNAITLFCINSTLFAVVLFDIFYGGIAYKPFSWIEWCLASILGLNSVHHLIRYTMAMFSLRPVTLTANQRKLLGISEDDPLFKNEVLSPKTLPEPTTPLNFSCMNLSRNSSALGTSSLNETKDYSASSPFSKYNSPLSRKSAVSPNVPINKSFNSSMSASFTGDDLIQDEVGLQNYLKEVTKKECKSTPHSTSVDQPSNLLSSFWSHPATRSPGEVSPFLRQCVYQLAPTVDKSKTSSPGAEEGSSPRAYGSPDVWRKYRIDPAKVNQWIANLRMWISKTVVERVALEIDNVCSSLIRHGLSDSQPGHVGLDKLRKLAQSFSVTVIPTLPALVPFLELSSNQEYLVKRIKILAKGGSMSEFKWNSGGSHNGKEWDSSLPTDTAIIMHLVSIYMDTQLEAPLNQPDARPFTSRYIAKSGSELPRSKGPIIVNHSTNPPHYFLALTGDSLEKDYEDIPRGRNNLFHTLLLFLYIVKTRDHGMLGRVNLGMSGVNVLWVID